MLTFKNDQGKECFGVRPEVPYRTTPLLRINLTDREIVGFFAITTVLPIERIPQKYRESIDINDPTTWIFHTNSPLDMYCYGFWKVN